MIASGSHHSLALKRDGTVWAWGWNAHGELGDGTTEKFKSIPVKVSGLSNVIMIAAGHSHNLALKQDGTVWAWGHNYEGLLGDGTSTNKFIPVQVLSLSNVTMIEAGDYHSLALKQDGTVWVWGRRYVGQLEGAPVTEKIGLMQVTELFDAIMIAAGEYHSLVLKQDGTVWAWGCNNEGQLGDGTNTKKSTPIKIPGLSNVIKIEAGGHHNFVQTVDGEIWAWGNNRYGQIGDGSNKNKNNPVNISELSNVSSIFAGEKSSYAKKSDGSIWAWGNIEKEMFDYSPIYIMSVLNLGEEIFLSDKYGLNLLWEDIDWENTIFSSQNFIKKNNDVKKIYTVDEGNFFIKWKLKNGETFFRAYFTSTIHNLKFGEEITVFDKEDQLVEWSEINWTKTIFYQQKYVVKVDYIKKLFSADEGIFSIKWALKNGETFTRRYFTSSIPVKEPVIVYYTQSTKAPHVNIKNIPERTIHYNESVNLPPLNPSEEDPNKIYLWEENQLLYAKGPDTIETNSMVILECNNYNPENPEDFLGIEIIQVKEFKPDALTGNVHVGSQLTPYQIKPDAYANVLTGNSEDEKLIYQHNVQYSPQINEVWATGENEFASKMEIIWMRKGISDVKWPYEYRQYTSEWPLNSPENYQVYLLSNSNTNGPNVHISESLYPTIENEKFMSAFQYAQLIQVEDNYSFSANGPGWVLLKYMKGPPSSPGRVWVGFEVVRCVLRDDNITPIDWEIGKEITNNNDRQPLNSYKTYIHTPEGDKYDHSIYDINSGGTGQIFAVNEGLLEVWWYNQSSNIDSNTSESTGMSSVEWPSKIVRYNAVWPSNPKKIIIARQSGTGLIKETDYGADWEIYFENNPEKHGFNPNEEHAIKRPYKNGTAVFALRNDLNTSTTSKPYVLIKYKKQPENIHWAFDVYKVVTEESPYFFHDWSHLSNNPNDPNFNPDHDPAFDPYEGHAGRLIQPPFPLSTFQYCQETEGVSGPFFKDRTGRIWAKAAGDDGSSTEITIHYYYPAQAGFYFPDYSHNEGDHVPFIIDKNTGQPVNVTYTINWPDNVPTMKINQTLIQAMFGLPAIAGQESVDIIYQQSIANGSGESVLLIDPVQTHDVKIDKIPDTIKTEQVGAEKIFSDLTLALRHRISYDPVLSSLKFKGMIVDPTLGFDYALLNVMSDREKTELLALSDNMDWKNAINALYLQSKNPVIINHSDTDPFEKLALTSGFAQGTGYVTLAMQNKKGLDPLPVSLEIIKIIPEFDPGDIMVITPQCPFDETLTLRHQGDFAGRTDDYIFEWRYMPDVDGTIPDTSISEWTSFITESSLKKGAIDITIKGPGLLTISDNWFKCRYQYTGQDMALNNVWSDWTDAQLAEGWIKRAIGDIDPFTQRASGGGIEGAETSFFSYNDKIVNTVVSMISQAGPRWEGSVPMNCQNLDQYGLIEIYETIFNRGKYLSIDGIPPVNYNPANTALLLVTSRISDLYMLLANEAYADASDPTIAFGSDDGQFGAEASSIHCFMSQVDSLIEEELVLLRGRNDYVPPGVKHAPVYNRFLWNFTKDITGGEVAYALNYNIEDDNQDNAGQINEADAKLNYPQGHGDAWGHYLSAIKNYYKLLKHPNYEWHVRSESILLGGKPIMVDYIDERKFANNAAAKARAGAEIVNMTYRSKYTENPDGQWQGYKDTDSNKAWGFSEWASRAGMGAYMDWVAGNAILPAKDNHPDHHGIQKIDRTTVLELNEIASHFIEIQSQLDAADIGLNPLGLANNVVPFDISPDGID